MSTRKLVCALSLGSFLVLVVGLVVGSEVRAGGLGDMDNVDLPVQALVDQDTLDQAQAFTGTYVFEGGQKQRDGVNEAIELSVASLNALIRNMGRKRLQETNTIPKQLSIQLSGHDLEILFDGDGHSAKLDGTPLKTKDKSGDKLKVSHRMRGAKLTELLDGTGGDRHNTFKLSDDGNHLTVKVKISSSQLPVPVEYSLRYKRK